MEETISSYPFRAEEYPGKIPSYSFFLSKDFVHELHIVRNVSLSIAIVDYRDEKIELSQLLKTILVKPLCDRYAILAYGSNACPSRLVQKKIFNLPILKASAKNVDVAYTYDKTNYGAVPATMVKSSNTLTQVWVSFLDQEQLKKMDESEGRRGRYYDLVELKDCQITLLNGKILSPVYAYVSNKKGIALMDGEPIALASIQARNRKFRALYQKDILNTIGECRRGESVDYVDFEVIPLGKAPRKFANSAYDGIVVDPTIFNGAERLRAFLGSMLSHDYTIAVASGIYHMISEEMWEELSTLLCSWEWNVERAKLLEWHGSSEFRTLCKEIVGLVRPCAEIMKEINLEERSRLQQVSRVIEQGSPRVVEIVKELITTSIVKRFPVLSFTRHAKRWFKTCKNVMIMEITDARNSVSEVKREIKTRVDRAGWRGFIYLFVFGLVADRLLEAMLPPPVGAILGKTSAGSFVICILADGKSSATI